MELPPRAVGETPQNARADTSAPDRGAAPTGRGPLGAKDHRNLEGGQQQVLEVPGTTRLSTEERHLGVAGAQGRLELRRTPEGERRVPRERLGGSSNQVSPGNTGRIVANASSGVLGYAPGRAGYSPGIPDYADSPSTVQGCPHAALPDLPGLYRRNVQPPYC
jgi:hypothetical protein